MALSLKFPALLIFLIFFIFFTGLLSAANTSSQPQDHQDSSQDLLQTCLDGTYDHEGKKCCKCAAGQRVVEHCETDLKYGDCDFCEKGFTYSSDPNGDETCQHCTSCNQPNANLEVDQPCTVASDTKCRCKKDHYCDTGICKTCSPCTICEHSVEKACTATNDTVCGPEANNVTVIIIITITIIILLIAGGIAGYFWRKRRQFISQGGGGQGIRSGEGQERQPLRDVPQVSYDHFQRLLPDIAEELGWGVMKEVAMCSGMKEAAIESCMRDYPNNNQEQTIELLKKWVEHKGKDASKELVKILDARGKRAKAEKVVDILSGASPV